MTTNESIASIDWSCGHFVFACCRRLRPGQHAQGMGTLTADATATWLTPGQS